MVGPDADPSTLLCCISTMYRMFYKNSANSSLLNIITHMDINLPTYLVTAKSEHQNPELPTRIEL